EALEYGGGAGAIGLAFPAVEEDHAGRPRVDLVAQTLRAPPAVAARLGRPDRDAAVGSRLDPPGSSRSRRRCRPRLGLRPARSESPPPWTLLHWTSLRVDVRVVIVGLL